jgi:hypothetical protein
MNSLTSYKSEIVQTVTCEIDMLKKGNLKCANQILKFRNEAMLRVFIIECLLDEDPVPQDMVNFLFEEIKEITRFLIKNKCINSNC